MELLTYHWGGGGVMLDGAGSLRGHDVNKISIESFVCLEGSYLIVRDVRI